MHKRFFAVACGILMALVALLGWCYHALHNVPEFYETALATEAEDQRQASDEMLVNATALASVARQEGHWEQVFTDEQVNGWLAVDLAKNYPHVLPDTIRDPRVQITDQAVHLACGYERGTLKAVVTIELVPYIAGPNILAVRVKNIRAGLLPVPMGDVLAGISRAAQKAEIQLSWQQADGDPVALITLPATLGRDGAWLRLETLQLAEGEIYVAGRTSSTPADNQSVEADGRVAIRDGTKLTDQH